MTTTINGRTPEEIIYDHMMYRLKRPNEWDEHCAGSLTLKGRVETAKWAYNYIQQLERERDAAVEDMRELISRMNAGEDVMACEYCAKRFGVCNCNCLNEFELRGVEVVN